MSKVKGLCGFCRVKGAHSEAYNTVSYVPICPRCIDIAEITALAMDIQSWRTVVKNYWLESALQTEFNKLRELYKEGEE